MKFGKKVGKALTKSLELRFMCREVNIYFWQTILLQFVVDENMKSCHISSGNPEQFKLADGTF